MLFDQFERKWYATSPPLSQAPELERQEPGVKTVKRWTTDLIEHNQLRNQPRLFDQITEAVRGARLMRHF